MEGSVKRDGWEWVRRVCMGGGMSLGRCEGELYLLLTWQREGLGADVEAEAGCVLGIDGDWGRHR